MVGGLQGEEWKFIQKYLKKRSKRVGGKYREASGTISQVKMVSAKYFCNNKLNSQGYEIGFHLEVLSVPACGMYRVASGAIP